MSNRAAMHPLAEVFGYPIDNDSLQARKCRQQTLCPFGNKTPRCTKDKKDDPLGVCSVFENGKVVVTCPVRFRQDWGIARDAARFFFPGEESWLRLDEVRLMDADGDSAGNIDVVIAKCDHQGRIVDFGSLEVQAVYISGNIRNPFEAFMARPGNGVGFTWTGPNYPRPDYLSSSRKRLAPQIQFKGGILHHWGKRMAVALDEHFFATLPRMPEVDARMGEIAWLVYGMRMNRSTNSYVLQLQRTVYTRFAESLEVISTPKPGSVVDFVSRLQKKLDQAHHGIPAVPAK